MLHHIADGVGSVDFDPDTFAYAINGRSLPGERPLPDMENRNHQTLDPYRDPAPIATINIANTMSCNMVCGYCYCGDLPLPRSRERASEIQLNQIRRFIRARAGLRASLVFIGGEPLTAPVSLEDLVLAARGAAEEHNTDLSIALYTNGLALTRRRLDWVNDNRIHLVISFDGLPEYHDTNRKLRSGAPSSGPILKNIARYRSTYWSGIRSVRAVATPAIDYRETVDFLRKIGFNDIGIQVAYGTDDVIDHEGLIEDYSATLEWYVEKLIGGDFFILRPFSESLLKFARRGNLISSHLPCSAGYSMLALSPSGNFVPCHHFFGDKKFDNPLMAKNLLNNRGEFFKSVASRSTCKDCIVRKLCGGACYHRSYRREGDYFGVNRSECAVRIALLPHIVRSFDRLLRKRADALSYICSAE